MSSWFGNGISQITGQISSFTKEVLTEGTEEVDDPATQLKITRDRLIELDTVCSSQRAEIERLHKVKEELQEKVESSELQIATISSEYRNIVHQKESSIQQLQHQYHALVEAGQRHTEPGPEGEENFGDHEGYSQYSSPNVPQAAARQRDSPASADDLTDIQAQIQSLHAQLSSDKDSHQAELAALQDAHSQKVQQLKKRHKEEVKAVKEELVSLRRTQENEASEEAASSASLSALREQVRHLESVSHKQSVDLSLIHAADKQKAELLEAGQAELKACQSQLDKVQAELSDVQIKEKNLLEDLDAVTDDNRRLKEHLAQMSQVSAFSPPSSTPLKKKPGSQSTQFEDNVDDSIISSDFSQMSLQTRRLDDQVISLQTQVDKYETEIEHFEMVKSDWLIEKEALEEVLMKLREQLREKEEALSIAQAQQKTTPPSSPTDVPPAAPKDEQNSQGLFALGRPLAAATMHDQGLVATPGEIEEDLEEFNQQVALLTEGSARLENEHDILVIEKEQLLVELQAEREKVSTLHKQLDAVKNEMSDHVESSHMTALESQLSSLKAELHEKEGMIDRLREEKVDEEKSEQRELEKELDVTKSQLEEVNAERDGLMESLEELDAQHQQAIQQMIESRQKLQQNHEDLKKEFETLQNKSQSVSEDSRTEGPSEEEVKLKAEVEALKTEVKQVQATVKVKDSDINTLVEDKTKMTDELKEKNAKLQEITLVLNELHMDKQEQQAKIEKLEKDLKVVREELKSSRGERKVSEEECARLKAELTSKSSEVVLLKEASRAVQSKEVQEKEEEDSKKRDDLQEEVGRLKKELLSLETEATLLRADNEGLGEQLASVRQGQEEAVMNVTREWEEKLERLGTEKSAVMSVRDSMERELSSTEHLLQEKTRQYEQYITELTQSSELNASELQEEHQRLMKVSHDKDGHIHKLQDQIQQLQADLDYTKDMLQTTIDGQSHITNLLADKDTEIDGLKRENTTLTEETEEQQNLIKQHQAELERLNHIEKVYKQLVEDHKKLKVDSDQLRKQLRDIETEESSKQIESKTLGVITDLEQELTQLQDNIVSKDQTIQKLNSQVLDLNQVVEDKAALLEQTNTSHTSLSETIAKAEQELAFLKEKSVRLETELQEKKELLLNKDNMIQTLQQTVLDKESALTEANKKLQSISSSVVPSQSRSASASPDFSQDSQMRTESPLSNGEENGDHADHEIMEKMRLQICERDQAIAGLKRKNHELEGVLEERSIALHGDATLVDIHRLEGEVRALRLEKEQMMQVLNDKTRECSQLKGEVHKLMSVVSAEKAALSKLQQDNQHLQSQDNPEPSAGSVPVEEKPADMSKEAIKKLSRIIRDKDLEIDSLGQKNETLLQVLQSSSEDGPQITGLIQERDNLAMQVSVFQSDRQQIVAALTTKHEESVAYHGEIQRLHGLISRENAKQDRLQQEYTQLVGQYEDRQRALVATQQELITFKQRLVEADSRYREVQQALREREERGADSREQSPQPKNSESKPKGQSREGTPTGHDSETKGVATVETNTQIAGDSEKVEVRTKITDSQDQVDNEKIVSEMVSKTTVENLGANNEKDPVEHSSSVSAVCCDHLAELESLRTVIQMQEQAFAEKDRVIQGINQDLASRERAISEKDSALDQKVKAYSELSTRFHRTEQMLRTRDTEMSSLRKQTENLTFQLRGLETEAGDLRQERDQLAARGGAVEQQMDMVKEANNKLSMALKDHAFELNALKEKNNTVTRLLQEKGTDDKEKGEMDRLMKETETLQHQARAFKVDADQFAMALQQQQEENRELKTEFQKVGEREQKYGREVERLRSHLMQVEEGYTRELLEAEEREKDLRNRLAAAEDRALSASSSVDRANLQAGKQVESLQQQLHVLSEQRDAAVMQLSGAQDQVTQYSGQLANLQMVLEQFQQEKEQQQAAEIEFYLREVSSLKQEKQSMQRELHQLERELAESNEAVAAAQRLSDQLDHKEEMISALREEVQLRERELSEAEERIDRLKNSVEGKIEKALARNLLLGYFHASASQKHKVIQVISKALDFSQSELEQLQGESSGGSWLRGIFKKSSPPQSQPSTPSRQLSGAGSIDKSFSELFVTFLEKESSPQPQVRLPAEEMAREQQERRRPHAFNPFTATVPSSSTPYAASLSSQHDPLGIGHGMAGPSLDARPLGVRSSSQSVGGGQLSIHTDEAAVNPFSAPVGRDHPQHSSGESHLLMAAASLPVFTQSSGLQADTGHTAHPPRSSLILKNAMQS